MAMISKILSKPNIYISVVLALNLHKLMLLGAGMLTKSGVVMGV